MAVLNRTVLQEHTGISASVCDDYRHSRDVEDQPQDMRAESESSHVEKQKLESRDVSLCYYKAQKVKMQPPLPPCDLFEFHRPREACAESQHGGEDDGGSMLFEPQAFLQPLAVLGHVRFPLLDAAGYPRHQLPVNHHLLLGAHEHLPQLLQPALHLPDDALALLHFQEAPPSRLELHAGAGSDELG